MSFRRLHALRAEWGTPTIPNASCHHLRDTCVWLSRSGGWRTSQPSSPCRQRHTAQRASGTERKPLLGERAPLPARDPTGDMVPVAGNGCGSSRGLVSGVGAQGLCLSGACRWSPSHEGREKEVQTPAPTPPKGRQRAGRPLPGSLHTGRPKCQSCRHCQRLFKSPQRRLNGAQAWHTWGPCLRECQLPRLAALLAQMPGSPHCLPRAHPCVWAPGQSCCPWGPGANDRKVGFSAPRGPG